MPNSLAVFREFIVESRGELDASGVVSQACYQKWLKGHKDPSSTTTRERQFQRYLTAHVVGADGRLPFTPQEEAAVLQVLRCKQPWRHVFGSHIRQQRFRSFGYHEKRQRTGLVLTWETTPSEPLFWEI